VSFFFYTHGDFFEEIAKYRAGRRRWAHIVRERYGAKDDRSCMFRVGCVAGGASLYAPQAHNNIVRIAYEALASVLGGVQSMFTAAWDEPFALPSEDSATLALRTQQVLASETGVARVADPLGGSYFVEALTDEIEARVVEIMEDLEHRGGMVKAVEDGYLHRLISEEAFRVQQAISSDDREIVGVNRFQTDEEPPEVEGYELDEQGRARQLERLAEVKRSRSGTEVREALDALGTAAGEDNVNLMPRLVAAAEAYCTVGEMVDVLKGQWGEFQQPTVF
jgi:methylmalonyl-CoA mutase N-terminal domain/subunit